MTVPDVVPVQMSAQARRVTKALAMENMEANAGRAEVTSITAVDSSGKSRCYC